MILMIVITFLVLFESAVDESMITGEVTAKNIFMYGAKRFLSIGLASTMFTAIVQSFTSTKTTKRIFDNIAKIFEIAINDFAGEVNLESFRKSLRQKLLFFVSVFAISHGILTIFLLEIETALVALVLPTLAILLLLCIMFKTVFYVSLINFTLQLLNQIIVDTFQCYPVKISENINYHLKHVKDKNDPLENLRKCRKLFNLIFETANMFNSCNGLTFLVLLCSLVTSITLSGFNFFVFVIKNQPIVYLIRESG
jgi:hypothetical protein